MRNRLPIALLACASMLVLVPAIARAGIHTWDVSEVFSNFDGSIQFVELREGGGGNGEVGVSQGTISSNLRPAGYHWVGPAVTNTSFKYYLVATQSFANLPNAPTPDAIIPPASIPFFTLAGDSVSFVVYDTCTFGAVPTDGTSSYDCLAHTTGLNSPTNYAGDSHAVDAPEPSQMLSLGAGALMVGALYRRRRAVRR